MNQTVQALMMRAAAALKGRPPLDGVILVDFGADGHVYIHADNTVAKFPATPAQPDCTITLSLDTLTKFETANGFERALMLADGDVDVQGDDALAEIRETSQFGGVMLSDIELARLCGAIYQDPSPVTWDKQYASLFCHAALKQIDGVKYLIRRGSKEPLDWYRDFDALPVEFGPLGTHVHPGVLAGVLWSFQEMEADLSHTLNGFSCVVLAGHSLGAGEIILQSGLLLKRGKFPHATVAFEPPRVAFESLCDPATTRCYRNQGDPVTEVPELELPFLGRYVPERAFIELAGSPDPADRGELRAHHIACVIAGLEKLAA